MRVPSSFTETPSIRLQLWAICNRGCRWLIDVEPYEVCRVAGIVRRLRLDPVNGYVEVTLVDGTGALTARWHLQRPTPQLVVLPPRGVVFEGIAHLAGDGRMVMDEPDFELVDYQEVE